MAEINFLPVCSECKSILKNVTIDYRAESLRGFFIPDPGIMPKECPVCGCVFDLITMPTRLPFVQEGE